jgi:hypothetical protein
MAAKWRNLDSNPEQKRYLLLTTLAVNGRSKHLLAHRPGIVTEAMAAVAFIRCQTADRAAAPQQQQQLQ